jgi:integrase
MDVEQVAPDCWLYRPGSDAGPQGRHKNAWRGQTRVIAMGPRAIAILMPWLRPGEPAAHLFSPKRAMAAFRASQRTRPKRRPGDCYTRTGYPAAVRRACERYNLAAKAKGLPAIHFNPYSLRHGRKMGVEREQGSEAARAVLGHKSIQTTTHYGTLDTGRAAEVMRKLG